MVSLVDSISQHSDGPHDQLIMEYKMLMTNPDGILRLLEDEFENSLDAEIVLGYVVMVC